MLPSQAIRDSELKERIEVLADEIGTLFEDAHQQWNRLGAVGGQREDRWGLLTRNCQHSAAGAVLAAFHHLPIGDLA